MPVTGAVLWRSNNTIGGDFLLCDGAAVSRTTYAALFAVISTTYGAGNGSTTFNVPNLIDRYPAGSGTGFGRGTQAGSKDHTHTGPSHTHTVTEPGAHDDHNTIGAHTHDTHTVSNLIGGTNTSTLITPNAGHSSEGGHAHDAHSAHSGAATVAGTGTTGSAEPSHMELVPVIHT